MIPRTAIATAEETIAAAAEWPGEGCALFSQYNIAVTKQGDNTTFSSIWSVDVGAGESLMFLRILALSMQLENVTNHHPTVLSGRSCLCVALFVCLCVCACR